MKLELGKVHIHDVQFDKETRIEHGVLYVNEEEIVRLVLEDDRLVSCRVELARPGESVRIAPVKDVIEPRLKIEGGGNTYPGVLGKVTEVGQGLTYCMDGAAVVTVGKPSIEVLLAKEQGTAKEKITCPVLNKNRAAYVVKEGATYVTLKPGERNYFLFTPDRDGVYRISTTSGYAKVGYYGGSIHFIQVNNLAEDIENNAFTVEVKDVGPTYVIGVDAATNIEATVLLITRVGDPGWSVADEPWITYKGSHTPKQYNLPSGTKLKNVDVTKTFKLVYNSTDGYYHKDSKTGPIVYLRFAGEVPYVAFADILNNFHVAAYLYDSAGNFQKKEEYTECMTAYNECVDSKEKVYPLTKDLEYILKSYGKAQGWWDTESPGYLFEDSDGNPLPNINHDIAWMFPLCYAN